MQRYVGRNFVGKDSEEPVESSVKKTPVNKSQNDSMVLMLKDIV